MELLSAGVFLGLLGALCITDIRTGLLPDRLTLSLLWYGLLRHAIYNPDFLRQAIIGAVAGYVTLWMIYWLWRFIRHQEGLGYGDFKLLAALGAWQGWERLPEIVTLASFSGLAVVAGRYLLRQPQARDAPLCFGPMLAAGGIIAEWGPPLRTLL